ncbi:valine--tRNA ligase [Ovoidimarina sediminis]|uniref:valine--tRNA ligase n=1 Tax=Ovoidimarina sediminis TaxID=3079856 RepID=UPI002912F125|nr:valine--tRNA ligase [Rhodophyticola sp. MJ-SS7]MDU8944922.1 valine--tRNA ligase [Rhodophyticola sp. MJ-SS7]
MEKTFDATEAEPRISAAWDEAKAFAAGANAKPGAETFSIMIPPPNVTGNLHMGHAFNNTLQDILVRWHRMQGHDTLWQPGTDHAGIATQMVVERELAKTNRRRTDFSREDFLALVWEQKQKSRGNIRAQLERLGASCDWDREAFTMAGAPGDPGDTPGGQNFHDAVIRVFVDMYEKGLIYRGKRLVNWDPHFETAISDLEVENIEVDGHMWHFKYPLEGGATYTYVERDEDGNVLFEEERDYISIATTRPETMLGDGAVAVHPSDTRYAPIVGKLCEIPVGPKEHRRLIPIITDDYPDPAFGSGAVKITGAHDFNDYLVASRNQIPMYRLMDTKGAMRADGRSYAEDATLALKVARGEATLTESECDAVNLVPDDLRGLDRFEARKRVVEQITSEDLAVMTDADDPRLGKGGVKPHPTDGATGASDDGRVGFHPTDTHDLARVPLVEAKKIMAPYGDRSKVVIEPMLTDQWFVDAEKIVGPAIDAVRDGTVQILPEQDKKVYFNWLEHIEPWCISRQLWWGHQIPVWYGPPIHNGDAPVPFCAASFDEACDKAKAHYPETWNITGFFEASDLYSAENWDFVGSVPLYRDPDVLDTWFSSGLWPIGTLGWPEDTPELQKYFPTSVLVTGFDIIFFWVARMMMMQYAVVGKHPFDTVYVHALVRDEKGKKMSKSLGNVLDPLDLVDEFGADAVRFTLASMAAMGRDLKLSTQRIAGYRNFTTKLWNAFRFAEMNEVFSESPCTGGVRDVYARHTVNKWIIGETARVREDVDRALHTFRFNDAANTLYAFVWGKVCDWYIEFAKPLFASEDPELIQETRTTMRWVLDQCLILLHPFMPFITEELWGETGPREKLLVHADWPLYTAAEAVDPKAESEIEWVISLIDAVRSVRGEMNVPAGLKVTLLELELDDAGRAAYEKNAPLIKRLARIEEITTGASEAPRGSATITVNGGTYALPLADIIDVAAEKARLSKSLEKLDKDLKGLTGRLKNPKFIESAPEDVVEETRELAAEKESERSRLAKALEKLEEVA